MKVSKEDAKMAWWTLGRLIVGTILCGAGFVTALKGVGCCGMVAMEEIMHEASPEEYKKIAEKLND